MQFSPGVYIMGLRYIRLEPERQQEEVNMPDNTEFTRDRVGSPISTALVFVFQLAEEPAKKGGPAR